ncbi:hypothetical protein Tco_1496154, partial [Tanacetum coccineum]
MSDSEDSTVTYMAVSNPFGGLSDIGSLGVDGPPVMLEDPYAYMVAAFQAPPSHDYVSGLEEPKQAPPLPKFVPEPVYPELCPESDPEEDLKEDDDEDSEEDPSDYPTDTDDDEEEEPFGDEADDEEEDKDDEEEEEEHPAPADSIPPPIHRVTAWISIRAQTPVSLPSDTEVVRLLDIPTPPSSPLSPWSSPLPQIPSPPLLVSPPLPISPPPTAGPTYPLGYRAGMIRLRAEALSTSHSLSLPPPIILSHTRSDSPPILPIPLPTSSPSLLLPSADHGADRPEVCLPPWKRLCITLGLRYEVGESSSAPAARLTGGFRVDYGFVAILDREIRRDPERYVGYGITDTWDEMLEDIPGALTTNETELGWRM